MTVTFTVPDTTPKVLRVSPDAVADEIRMLAAVKLFELARVSSGVAAEVAGIPRVVFLQSIGDYGAYTFDYTEEELQREAKLD